MTQISLHTSVTSILLLNKKKKQCSQGNQSILDLLSKAKRPAVSISEVNSLDVDDSSTATEIQTMEFTDSDDDSLTNSPCFDYHANFDGSSQSATSDVDAAAGTSELEDDSDIIHQLSPMCYDSTENENELLPFPNLSRSWYVNEQKNTQYHP